MDSVYCPQNGRSIQEKEIFYDELIAEDQKHGKNYIVMGEFNGHVGSFIDGYEGVFGCFGWRLWMGRKEQTRREYIGICWQCGTIIDNTYFQNDDK